MKIKGKSLLLFTQSVSSLLNSSMKIQDALRIILQTSSDKRVREVSKFLHKEILSGRMLYQALTKAACFSQFYIMLVKTGEESAALPVVFTRLCDYLKGKEERRSRTVQALLYPALVFVTVAVVMFILAFFVFPRLSEVFEVLESHSGNSSDRFNSMVGSIKIITVSISAVIILTILFTLLTFRNRKFRYLRDRAVYHIPLIRNMVRNRNTSLFCFSMKTLIGADVHTEDALLLTEQAQGNLYFRAKLKEAMGKVQSGRSLSECLSDKSVFPPYFSSHLKIGESTGELGRAFSEMESFYKAEDERATEVFIRCLEPALIVLTGILVFAVIWRFIVPLYSMLGEL